MEDIWHGGIEYYLQEDSNMIFYRAMNNGTRFDICKLDLVKEQRFDTTLCFVIIPQDVVRVLVCM